MFDIALDSYVECIDNISKTEPKTEPKQNDDDT
jgi:hypothetical protein